MLKLFWYFSLHKGLSEAKVKDFSVRVNSSREMKLFSAVRGCLGVYYVQQWIGDRPKLNFLI